MTLKREGGAGYGGRAPARLVHLLHSLEVGGLERIAISLARAGRSLGLDHRLVVFDRPPAGPPDEFERSEVPCAFLQRRPGLDLSFAWRLGTWLAEQRVELVHAHNDTAISYAALAGWMRGRGVARVGTFHTLPTHGGRAARWLSCRATGPGAETTSVSQELADRIQAEGWTARPSFVVENGVDLEAFRPGPRSGTWREVLGVSADSRVLLCVARLSSVKRHADLVRAFRAARGVLAECHGLSCELWLAGEGPERERLEQLVSGAPDVRLLGNVVEVSDLLREADAFALVSEHEAQPLALMEAMATGLPCVATRVGGVPEIAGDAIRLVAPGDLSGIAAALSEVLDPRRAGELGRLARERIQARSSGRLFESYAEVWGRALSSQRP